MCKFFFKILKTTAILYFILFAFQFVLDFSLDQENACKNNTWYKIFNRKLDTEIVILGNSRAEAHYDTEIISAITNKSTYNLGLSGTPINILNIRWQAYINRNKKPKILLLDLDNMVLGTTKTLFKKFQYLPYTNEKEYIKEVRQIDEDYWFEFFIPLYKYRGYEMDVFKQIKGNINLSLCNNSVNGYIKNEREWDENSWLLHKVKAKKDTLKNRNNFKAYEEGIDYLNDIVKFCKKNKIKTYFIWSPLYYETHNYRPENRKYIDSVLNDLATLNNIKYYNFSRDSITFIKDNFYDKAHLNKAGASIFSKKIAKIINKDLINNKTD